jgi:tRNA pseudouridine38-40 synthase
VRILEGFAATDGFDANRSAKRKTYRYSLYVAKRDMPLKERYAVRIESAPTLEKLQQTAKWFEGEHDFKACCASGSSVKTTVRTVYEVRVEESQSYGGRNIDVYVTGNGFLYNMVRTIVGELLELSEGKKQKESLLCAFETGQRELLAKTMPAKGLTLLQVDYEV